MWYHLVIRKNRNQNQTIPFHNPRDGNLKKKKKENNKYWKGREDINIITFLYKKVHSIIIHISKKKSETTQNVPSVDTWINKTWHMHTTTKKKNEMTFYNMAKYWKHPKMKKVRHKCHIYPFTCTFRTGKNSETKGSNSCQRVGKLRKQKWLLMGKGFLLRW